MPGLYIGGAGTNPFSGFGGGPPAFGGKPPMANNGQPMTNGAPTAPPQPPNVLGAQAVRATGDPKGYDSSYLQNLATAIGGLFNNSKQGGNVMSLNPLGDLSDISPSSGMGGNAPLPGIPNTWLQDALNGLGFKFGAPAAPKPAGPTNPAAGGGGGSSGGRGRLPINLQ